MIVVTLSELPSLIAKSHSSSAASDAVRPSAKAVRALVTASVLLMTSHKPSDAMMRNSWPGRREIDRHSGLGINKSAMKIYEFEYYEEKKLESVERIRVRKRRKNQRKKKKKRRKWIRRY